MMMKRKNSILMVALVMAAASLILLYYSHKEALVSCATEYFQHKQSKTEYFSFRYKELDSVYSSYHVDKIGFIQGDQFNVEDASDSIIYVTHSDKMVDLLNKSGKSGCGFPNRPILMSLMSSRTSCCAR